MSGLGQPYRVWPMRGGARGAAEAVCSQSSSMGVSGRETAQVGEGI